MKIGVDIQRRRFAKSPGILDPYRSQREARIAASRPSPTCSMSYTHYPICFRCIAMAFFSTCIIFA